MAVYRSAGRGELERANGVEPSRASLATMPRTMRARVSESWSGRQDLHLRPPSSRLGRLLLTYALRVDTPTGVAPASSRFAGDRLRLLGHGVMLG